MTPTVSISDSLRKLAEMYPEKFTINRELMVGPVFSLVSLKTSELLVAHRPTQDVLDSILAEVGVMVCVGLDLPDKPINGTVMRYEVWRLGTEIHSRMWWNKTDIQTTEPQAQLLAKCVGFNHAVSLLEQERKGK